MQRPGQQRVGARRATCVACALGALLFSARGAPALAADPALAVLEGARSAPLGQAVARVVELLRTGPRDELADRALELLADLGSRGAQGSPACRELLAIYAHHRLAPTRARAYAALGGLRDREATELVQGGLHDASAEVRAASARALARLDARQASATLLRALAHGVPEAAPALGQLGDAATLDAYTRLLGRVRLDVMLTGYDAFLQRKDLADAAKLQAVAQLEELGTRDVRGLFSALLARKGFRPSAPLRRALTASVARLTPAGKPAASGSSTPTPPGVAGKP